MTTSLRSARQKPMLGKSPVQRAPLPTHALGSKPLSHDVARRIQEQMVQRRSPLTPNSLTPSDVLALQRSVGNQVVQRLLDKQGTLPAKAESESASRPLPTAVRAKMERSFGTSFANVRIHQGSEADAMDARAYAQGSNIYVQRSINVNGYEGQKVLAHELAHVVQQRTGRVPNASTATINDNPQLETEAHRAANKAANGAPVGMAGGISHVQRAPTNVIQRWPKWLKKMFTPNEEKRQARKAKKAQRRQEKQEFKQRRREQVKYLNANDGNPEVAGEAAEFLLKDLEYMGLY